MDVKTSINLKKIFTGVAEKEWLAPVINAMSRYSGERELRKSSGSCSDGT
ncbi:MAG: hypothetical protein MZV64_66885 [Ignavibacteriales bacterium]|nr:hypothetical protein [Ignavibacteriales bacterium]